MKHKQAFILLFITTTLLLGNFTTSASAVSPDQISADLIVRDRSYHSSSRVFKGNTSESPLELVYSSSNYYLNGYRVRSGQNDVSIDKNDTHFKITSNVSVSHSIAWRNVNTFYQKDAYISDIPTEKRFKRANGDFRTVAVRTFVDRTLEYNHSIDELKNNVNWSEHTSDTYDLTAFTRKMGSLQVIDFNDTAGNVLGQVLGFVVDFRIIAFQTSTGKFVGYHSTTEWGAGNMLPNNVINYLTNATFREEVGVRQALGYEIYHSNDYTIKWMDMGHNTTLNLDMYVAGYEYNKHSYTVLVDPSIITNDGSLQLNSVNSNLEGYIDALESEYLLDEYDNSKLDDVDDELMDEVVRQENLDLLSSITESEITPENALPIHLGIYSVLSIGIVIYFRRKQASI